MNSKHEINIFLSSLKELDILPSHIEKSVHKGIYFYNLFDKKTEGIISYETTTGIHFDENTALLKALSERVERAAFKFGYKNNIEACQTEKSDGFAAFPFFNESQKQLALLKSKENALAEAIERFVWASWWDQNTDAKIEEISSFSFLPNKVLLDLIESKVQLRRIFKITPKTSNFLDFKTIIFFIEIDGFGYLSGGATGKSSNDEQIIFRALSELVRHSIGFRRSQEMKIEPKSFYDERLLYFASGKGNELVLKRLFECKSNIIEIQKLKWDVLISHPYESLYCVHRCLIMNQPPFVGGNLERLCL